MQSALCTQSFDLSWARVGGPRPLTCLPKKYISVQKKFVQVLLLRLRAIWNEVGLYRHWKWKCGSLTMECVADALIAVFAGSFAVVALLFFERR